MTAKTTKTDTKPDTPQQEVLPPERNALTTTVTPKLDSFMRDVIPPKSAKSLWASLPDHISPDVFKRNLYNALAANPKLMDYAPALLFREISKAAGLGLLLDPLLGEAYMIEAYNYKSGKVEPQLRVGYKGFIKLARQSGNVAALWCHEVREHDFVEADLGFPKRYTHRPVLFGDRGNVIGYTAVITYREGGFDFEPMSKDECLAIRDRSDAWKAYEAKKIKSTPWATDEIEMSKKTVFNRLMKRQDKSPELRRAIDIENEAEFPSLRASLEADPQERLPKPTAPTPPEEGEDVATSRDRSTERVKNTSTRTERQAPVAPPPPEDEEPVAESTSPAEPPVGAPIKDVLTFIDGVLGEITPALLDAFPDILSATWEERCAPRLMDAFPLDVDEAQSILRKHEKRLGG